MRSSYFKIIFMLIHTTSVDIRKHPGLMVLPEVVRKIIRVVLRLGYFRQAQLDELCSLTIKFQ